MEHTNVQFVCQDATYLNFENQFDAVFSNATLHWILEPRLLVKRVYASLKSGGRFVTEFGGKGNIKTIQNAISITLNNHNLPIPKIWYFPSISEYTTILEAAGFTVTYARLYDRDTKLEGANGMYNWLKMFGFLFLNNNEMLINECVANLQSNLRNGEWYADYKRLQIVAYKDPLDK